MLGTHGVVVRDRFRIPRPGETEVKVEDSPGVTIHHARVGSIEDPTHDYRFVGPGGPLSDDGLDVSFTAGDRAPLSGTCGQVAARRGKLPAAGIIVVAAALGCALAGVVVWRRRRRLGL